MDYTTYCSLTFNGSLLDEMLDGYTTINVEGRGLIGRVLSTVDITGRDGARVTGSKVSARGIRVHFLLEADNNSDFMGYLHILNDALKSDGDVQFQFGDEEYYRFGRLAEVENPPFDNHRGVGVFTLFCQDPFKYKDAESLTGASIAVPDVGNYPYRIKTIESTIATTRTGFTITNTTTGRKIILTGSFPAGQKLVIDHVAGTITLNTVNIKSRLDYINSDWRNFEINAGDTITADDDITIGLSERGL